jgi:hypothetical protein
MAEAEYWRFTVARDCQKKNTSETHSAYKLAALGVSALPRAPLELLAFFSATCLEARATADGNKTAMRAIYAVARAGRRQLGRWSYLELGFSS